MLQDFKIKKFVILLVCIILLIGTIFILTNIDNTKEIHEGIEPSFLKSIKDRSLIDELRTTDTIREFDSELEMYISHSSSTKEILIEDKDYNTIVNMRLTSDYVVSGLIASSETKVAEFYLEDWKDGKTNLIDTINFHDAKDNYKPVNKNFRFKYGTEHERCLEEKVCYNYTTWTEFETLDELPHKNIKVSLWANTEILERIEWIPTIEGFEILQWAEWQISTMVYTGDSFNVSGYDILLRDVFYKPEGDRWYLGGETNQKIYSFNITNYNVSTSIYNDFCYIGGEGASLRGFWINETGTGMLTIAAGEDEICQYILTIPWGIGSCSYIQCFPIGSINPSPSGISANATANKVYFTGYQNGNDNVYELNLTLGGNLSSAVYNQKFDVSAKSGVPIGLFFETYGNKNYIIDAATRFMYEYNLSTKWDVGTMVYSFFYDFSAQDPVEPRDICFSPDGTHLLLAGDTNNYVYGYYLPIIPDTTNPDISIVYPINNSNFTIITVDVNYTVSDLNLDSCWYSNDSYLENTSLGTGGSCGNITTVVWSQGQHNVTVWANDTSNHLNFSLVTFTIDSILPDISIVYPINNSNFTIITVDVNYTVSDLNLDSCWYSNDSYLENTSLGTVGVCINITTITWSEGQHNVTVWANDTYGNVNFSLVTFTIDTTNPEINITSPIDFIDYHLINTNLTFNWTISDTNLGACWFIYGGTNTTVTCTDLNISLLISNHSDRTFSFYANDTFGNINNDSVTWNYYVFENNQTFNNVTTEGNLETFLANIFRYSGVTVSNVILVYNSTNYTGESFVLGDSTILRLQNLVIPSIATETNQTFYWDLILSNGVRVNLTAYYQTVYDLGMDNCTTYTTRILNLTVYDEELQTLIINATIETAVNLYSSDRSELILNVSGSYLSPTGICLSLNLSSEVSYSFDAIIRYEATGYANEYYNIANFTLTNNTEAQHISLYDLNSSDSTDFQLTFTGSDFLVVENALVYVNRQYISENLFKTVELPKTDYNGQTILHLVRNDIVYNILVMKNNEVLGTFNNIIAFCEDYTIGDCKISLTAFDSVENVFDYNSELGITFSGPSFDDITKVIAFNFLSVDGTQKNVLMNVTRSDIFGNRTVCEDSLISAGGTLTCTVPSNIDESILRVSVYVDGIDTVHRTIELDPENYGVAGFLVFFVMAITMILMFSSSKTGVLIGIVLAFVSAVGLNLISADVIGLGASGLWLFLIIILAIWKLNKERIQ